jgi:hypothetical protein
MPDSSRPTGDEPTRAAPGAEQPSHLEQAYAELGDHLDRFRRLYDGDDHQELLGALRDDTAFALAVARADCITYLRKWFTRTDGWQTVDERCGATGAAGVAVEWTYRGVHDGEADFNGLSPTGRPVMVRGVTVTGIEKGRLKLHRYVDWAGVFAQLGLSLNWRVPVSSTPPAAPGDVVTGGPVSS